MKAGSYLHLARCSKGTVDQRRALGLLRTQASAQMSQLVPRSCAPMDLNLQPKFHDLSRPLHSTKRCLAVCSYRRGPEPAHVAAQPANLPRLMTGKQVAVVVKKFNKEDPTEAVETIEKDVREVEAGQAQVRMIYRPINPSDIFCCQGIYGGFRPELPATPGLEGVGVVHKLGPKLSSAGTETARNLKEGQRVVGVPWPSAEGEGTWQQYVNVSVENLIPVRDEVSDEDAAQYLINPVTALGFLEDLQVPPDKYLLQNAANSVLGKELIALAKARGTRMINVVRRDEAANELRRLGAEVVINSSKEDIVESTMQITGGEGAWAAINPIGGEASRPFFSAVREGGLVYIFSMFGEVVIVPMYDLHFRDITVRGFWLNKWLGRLPKDVREQKLLEVMDFMADGTIKPPPPRAKYVLKKVKAAMREATEGHGQGKVLLKG